jgi:hypothetical protein
MEGKRSVTRIAYLEPIFLINTSGTSVILPLGDQKVPDRVECGRVGNLVVPKRVLRTELLF